MDRAKGAAGPGRGKAGHSVGPAFTEDPTLSELGLSKDESAQAREGRPRRLSAGDGCGENGESAGSRQARNKYAKLRINYARRGGEGHARFSQRAKGGQEVGQMAYLLRKMRRDTI